MKHRILVVEDEPAVSRGVRDALEFNGYAVEVAESGERGYSLASDGTFDLIDIWSDRDATCVGIPGPGSVAVPGAPWPPPAAPPIPAVDPSKPSRLDLAHSWVFARDVRPGHLPRAAGSATPHT